MRWILLWLAFCGMALAQNADLSGIITDPSGSVVPGATVTVTRTETDVRRVAHSDNEGRYSLSSLLPGRYLITVQKQGFQTMSRTNVQLETAQNARIDFQLSVGTTETQVNVSSEAELINTTDGSVSTVVSRDFVENIPLNGRSMQSLITMAPGILQVTPPYGSGRGDSGQFSVNGLRTESNYFTVDGVSGNHGVGPNGLYGAGAAGSVPGETALGTTQPLASLDAVQEFRLQTSSYSAEYGRSPGAQVTLITRSGTNEFHGTLYEYFRNDALDSNNWFNNRAGVGKTAERQNDFGGTLGGPVIIPGLYKGKDRTFFFFSQESVRLQVPQGAYTTEVPTISLRQNAPAPLHSIMNAFPVPNGPAVVLPGMADSGLAYFTAAYSNPSSLDSPSIRIDHRFSDKISGFARYNSASSAATSRATSYALSVISDSQPVTKTLTTGLDYIISPRIVNSARFNYSWTSFDSYYHTDSFGGAAPITVADTFAQPVPKWSQSAWGIEYGTDPFIFLANQRSPSTQWNAVDSLSYMLGNHLLKFGFDYRRTVSGIQLRQFEDGFYYYTPAEILANSASVAYVDWQSARRQNVKYPNFSSYVQDEWKVTPSLTLSLGLRWDVSPPPTNITGPQPPVLDQTTDFLTAHPAPAGTPIFRTDYSGVGPRLGMAYQLRQDPRWATVLRAGWGRFFDTSSTRAGWAFLYTGYDVRETYADLAYPLAPQYYNLPLPSPDPPYQYNFVAFNRNLKLPYADQWNITLEQKLGSSRSLSVGYVGTAGRNLIDSRSYYPSQNPDFSNGYALIFVDNLGDSDYNSLQVQFRQNLAHGLQALLSYTWSHAFDNSSNSYNYTEPLVRGNSDFDIRHVFQGGVTYNIPFRSNQPFARAILKNWGIDSRITLQTALPLDVYTSTQTLSSGQSLYFRPNVVPGQPLYSYGPQYPGGKAINYYALQVSGSDTGNLPRNLLRGFPAEQVDISLRRDFPLTERLHLQFRGEAFNIFNHPNFGNIQNNWGAGPATFGRAQSTLNSALSDLNALYQLGGPRSIQIAAKLVF